MCGRYVHPDDAAIERAWHVGRQNSNPFTRRFNVAPTMPVPILRRDTAGKLTLDIARWGFIPIWWKETVPPKSTINARSEEAAAKPMWRTAYRQSRCLIPAQSWYEWRTAERIDPSTGEVKTYKQPFNIHRCDRSIFCFAGLLSTWKSTQTAEPTLTCAILTKAASPPLIAVHDRMPVVLPEAQFETWTDPRLRDAAAVDHLLAAHAEGDFDYYPVSTRVNNSKWDDEELIAPLPRAAA